MINFLTGSAEGDLLMGKIWIWIILSTLVIIGLVDHFFIEKYLNKKHGISKKDKALANKYIIGRNKQN